MTADGPESAIRSVERMLTDLPTRNIAREKAPFKKSPCGPIGIEISSSVNFVAKVWRCGSEEMGPLFVLAKNLSTGYLWNKIRVEGGAYGGMALVATGQPVFSCASYRDPNLLSTLNHFEAGLALVAKGLDADSVDQNIIATIGRIDAPKTPHEKGFGETVALLCGRSREYRRQLRDSVLRATSETLRQKAMQLLDEKETAVTVIGSASAFDQAEKEGLQLTREKLLP
jgi:Zn-dependent M16 (insulinase) family peptidase